MLELKLYPFCTQRNSKPANPGHLREVNRLQRARQAWGLSVHGRSTRPAHRASVGAGVCGGGGEGMGNKRI